jgi:hypothetical protein
VRGSLAVNAYTPPGAPPKPSRPWWQFALLGCGGLLLLGVVYWFNQNKDKLVSMGKEANESAAAFAAGHTQSDCVDEALRKVDACDGILCESGQGLFVTGCLRQATPVQGFCDGVPAPGQIMDTATWVREQCVRRNRPNDQRCARLMQHVPKSCHGT